MNICAKFGPGSSDAGLGDGDGVKCRCSGSCDEALASSSLDSGLGEGNTLARSGPVLGESEGVVVTWLESGMGEGKGVKRGSISGPTTA